MAKKAYGGRVTIYPNPNGAYIGGVAAVVRVVDAPVAETLTASGAFVLEGEGDVVTEDDGDIRLHVPELYSDTAGADAEPTEPAGDEPAVEVTQ